MITILNDYFIFISILLFNQILISKSYNLKFFLSKYKRNTLLHDNNNKDFNNPINNNSSNPLWPLKIATNLAPFTWEEANNVNKRDQNEIIPEDTSKGIIPIGPKSSQTKQDKLFSKPINPESQKYFQLIQKLTPNDMIAKFAQSAPLQVQEAAKSTILTLFGSLPNYALDAALVTTNSKLANLLFQMQITGYMFKNAEYRMSLTKSLKGLPKLPSKATIQRGNITIVPTEEQTTFSGKVSVKTTTGEVVQIDVNDLTDALSKEVSSLRNELMLIRSDREKDLRSNLLTYIQALPENDLSKLTSDMSPEVMDSIKMLVNALMEKMGVDNTGPQEVVIQQNVGVLAQLCMWQLVTGYKLREYEALEKGVPLD